MKKYALFIVYGTVTTDGETWYRVSYNNQTGYVNGKYFKQMTIAEAEEFLSSSKYQEGLANNSTVTTTDSVGSQPVTTGIPDGVVSAEDQKVNEWVNPDTGSSVSYEPFDPFATPEPLAENELEKNEFVNGILTQIQDGTLTEDQAQIELEKYYKDHADPEGAVTNALAYIHEKLGTGTETPSEIPEPLETEEPENPQEETTGGSPAGVIIVIVLLLAAAGGGGYYWYIRKQRQREAAQRLARKKAAQGGNRPQNSRGSEEKTVQAASAQNRAKVRTGQYTGGTGSNKTKATPSGSAKGAQSAGKNYGSGTNNPYKRYSRTETEEDAAYTASFKPNADKRKVSRTEKNPDTDESES